MEVLIAVVLLGILSAALYGSYFGVIKARDSVVSGMESQRELGATLDLIRREIASVCFNSKVKDTQHPLRFVVQDRDNFGLPSSILELSTLAPPDGQARSQSGIVVVTYQMADKDNKRILTRQERDLFSEEKTIPAYPQMEEISSFLVECSSDGVKWVKTWDTANQPLPKSVRITVQVGKDSKEGKAVAFSVLATPRVSAQ